VVLVGERTLYLDRTQSNLLHRHSPETHQCAMLWYGDSKAGEGKYLCLITRILSLSFDPGLNLISLGSR
jgi:hypothetical protein